MSSINTNIRDQFSQDMVRRKLELAVAFFTAVVGFSGPPPKKLLISDGMVHFL
jgi:hypothetical protein